MNGLAFRMRELPHSALQNADLAFRLGVLPLRFGQFVQSGLQHGEATTERPNERLKARGSVWSGHGRRNGFRFGFGFGLLCRLGVVAVSPELVESEPLHRGEVPVAVGAFKEKRLASHRRRV